MATKAKQQKQSKQQSVTQPEAKQGEALHVFFWEVGAANILRDMSRAGLHEFDNGLESYLQAGQYRILPGSPAPLEIWETSSEETPSRFLVIGRYGGMTLAFQIEHVKGLRSWLKEYQPVSAILPYVVFPEPVQAPNNHVVYTPVVKQLRW